MHLRDVSPEKLKTVVLIHGQVFDSTVFDEALPSLDARVLLPDMPGHGASRAELVTDFVVQQEQLTAAISAKGARELHLVGYSLGSYHALALALAGRLPVRSLTMLGPWPGADAELLEAMAGLAPAIESGKISWVDVFLANCFSPEFAASHPATVASTRGRICRGSAHTLIEELKRMPAMPDLRPRVKDLDLPVLVRVGEKDPSTPAAFGEALAKSNPRVRLEVVPGVAHHYLAQDFEGTVGSLKRFIGV